MRNFRVFVSSPGDVAEERRLAHEILSIMPEQPAWQGKIGIEVVRWDNPHSPTPMYANLAPQEAVNQNLPKPSECDLVVLILWGRFGTPLAEPLKPDGSHYLSGTEWEYEDAITGKVPILLYRRISDPQVSLRDPPKDVAEKQRQLALVDEFFKRLTGRGGAAEGGYIPYKDVADFKDRFRSITESAIRQLLEAKASSPSQSLDSLLAIVDRLTLQNEEKDKEIARLTQILILKSASPQSTAPDKQRSDNGTVGRPAEPNIEVRHLDSIEAEATRRDPTVTAIAPVFPMKLVSPFVDSDVSAEMPIVGSGCAWGVAAVGADTSPFTGSGVTVAVIDTGIDAAHPAFSGLTIVERDFTGEGNGDWDGHGTHFAGTVFGRSVSGTRIGVAPGVKRGLIAKVIGARDASTDALFAAMQWAVEEESDVIAMSLHFDVGTARKRFRELGSISEIADSQEALRANIRMFDALLQMIRARSAFVPRVPMIVAAAGNQSQRDVNPDAVAGVSFPASADGVISVAALSQGRNGLTISPFSNAGAVVSAPGARILSSTVGGLKSLSGTSMAAAHVAGVAALWAEKLATDSQSSALLSARLLSSASRDTLQPGFDRFEVGNGLVRAPQD